MSVIANSGIDVYAHNMETVERLTGRVMSVFDFIGSFIMKSEI